MRDRDWTETKKPHVRVSKLAQPILKQACARVKIEHTEPPSSTEKRVFSDRCEESTPPVSMEVAGTLTL